MNYIVYRMIFSPSTWICCRCGIGQRILNARIIRMVGQQHGVAMLKAVQSMILLGGPQIYGTGKGRPVT